MQLFYLFKLGDVKMWLCQTRLSDQRSSTLIWKARLPALAVGNALEKKGFQKNRVQKASKDKHVFSESTDLPQKS